MTVFISLFGLDGRRKSKESLYKPITNQYLIINRDEGVLLDPGGIYVFPQIVANVSRWIDVEENKVYLLHPSRSGCILRCSPVAQYMPSSSLYF